MPLIHGGGWGMGGAAPVLALPQGAQACPTCSHQHQVAGTVILPFMTPKTPMRTEVLLQSLQIPRKGLLVPRLRFAKSLWQGWSPTGDCSVGT